MKLLIGLFLILPIFSKAASFKSFRYIDEIKKDSCIRLFNGEIRNKRRAERLQRRCLPSRDLLLTKAKCHNNEKLVEFIFKGNKHSPSVSGYIRSRFVGGPSSKRINFYSRGDESRGQFICVPSDMYRIVYNLDHAHSWGSHYSFKVTIKDISADKILVDRNINNCSFRTNDGCSMLHIDGPKFSL